ncbi:hypothetical protein G6F68_020654 [Rhizopus microsporus]|nr:hypothetical protein G6F68_020654 [Rhizopus microsporus]
MQVRVAHAAIENLHRNVVVPQFAPLELEQRQRGVRAMRGVAYGLHHQLTFFVVFPAMALPTRAADRAIAETGSDRLGASIGYAKVLGVNQTRRPSTG